MKVLHLTRSSRHRFHVRHNLPCRMASTRPDSAQDKPPQHIVVVGSGFAAHHLIRSLNLKEHYRVSMVSPRPYHLYTPNLYGVASGSVSELSTVALLGGKPAKNLTYVNAEATKIDLDAKTVQIKPSDDRLDPTELRYDYIVVSCGEDPSFMGVPGAQEYSTPLRELNDAQVIRNRLWNMSIWSKIVTQQEASQAAPHLHSVVVVGAGATGVEVAGALSDSSAFLRTVGKGGKGDTGKLQVTLVEAGPRILPSCTDWLVARAEPWLARRVRILTNTKVVQVEPDGVILANGEWIPANTVIWSTGTQPRQVVINSGLPLSPRGRILVDSDLRIAHRRDAFAIGDCADVQGESLPAVVSVARAQAFALADQLLFNARMLRGLAARPYYSFRNIPLGLMVYMGKGNVLLDTPYAKTFGRLGYVVWRLINAITFRVFRMRVWHAPGDKIKHFWSK